MMNLIRLTISLCCVILCSSSFAGGGYTSECRDPVTGMLNVSKFLGPQGVGKTFTPYIDDRDLVSSIQADGDNKMIYTMKDGSQRVFERDPFVFDSRGIPKKERPWVQTR